MLLEIYNGNQIWILFSLVSKIKARGWVDSCLVCSGFGDEVRPVPWLSIVSPLTGESSLISLKISFCPMVISLEIVLVRRIMFGDNRISLVRQGTHLVS